MKKQDGRFVAMVTKDVQTLNLKFLALTWKRNFEVNFCILSVLVFQITVPESYLDIYLFKISYDQKCKNCDNLGL